MKSQNLISSKRARNILLILLGMGLCFAIIRDTFTTKHDFSGYVIAGELAYNHQDIYSHYLNTWPPSFSVISIPLYLLNNINSNVLQFLWLTGFCLCLVLCLKWTYELVTGKEMKFNLSQKIDNAETLNSWIIIIPFLLGMRILIEEIVNIQINIYLMTLCLLALRMSNKGKDALGGLLIAFTIACKVYTVILIPFIFFRKKWKFGISSIAWLGVLIAGVFTYFGFDVAKTHHINWWTKDVVVKHIYDHGNQSIWGLVTGLTSNVERLSGVKINVLSVSLETSKLIGLVCIGIIAIIVGIRFIRTYNFKNAWNLQYIVLLSFIPLFSPIAWKYYFVFVAPLTMMLYLLTKGTKWWYYFLIPSLIITLTSELFLGRWGSDVTEAFGIITICSLFLSLLGAYILTKNKTHQT